MDKAITILVMFFGIVATKLALIAGLIAWGVQPLLHNFDVYLPFWPLYFTAWFIAIVFGSPNINTKETA